MPAIESKIDTGAEAFARNRAHMLGLIETLRSARSTQRGEIRTGKTAVRQARAVAAARARRAPSRSRRAVAGAFLDLRLRPRYARPRQIRAGRRDDRRHRLRVRRALHGGRERLRHRCRRDPAHGAREAVARAGACARQQASLRASGRIRGRESAALPGRRIHPRRRDLPQPREALGRRHSGHHGGARLVHGGWRLHAGPFGLRDHGARARQGIPRRAAAAESRDRRDRHRRGTRRRRDAYARLGARRISRRGRCRRRAASRAM